MEKPTLPKGTRDFGPAQMAKRQFIFDNIRKVFQKYGFQPLETPAMENLSTLTGKYGDEGDQLLFKVLNSGDYTQQLKENLNDFTLGKTEKIFRQKMLDFFKSLKDKIVDKNVSSIDLDNLIETHNDVFFNDEDPVFKNLRSYILANSTEIGYDINKDTIALSESHFPKFFSYNSNDILNHYLNPLIVTKQISEKGLRYDLTVPFARYVVMNRGEMTFPFKRYQIQPVWRADRPQKGRYREFYQCDADVVGTDSLICEAEIILMIREVFKALGIGDYTIKINHRGVLAGLAELAGAKENQVALFVAIDKLDKIGEAKVKEELIGKGFSESSLNTVFEILNFKGTTIEKVALLQSKFAASESGLKGIKDLTEAFSLLADYGTDQEHVEFDIALARGLSYYTGCIFEVKINNVAIGSVSGGGRYDNLTGGFGLPNVSGVGISFGVDRLYDAMEEISKTENRNLFPESALIASKVLICHFDEESKRYGLKVVNTLRHSGIASEIYPDSVKINKQLDYANKKMIPYTIVIGSDEVKSGVLAFKDMNAGVQEKMTLEDIVERVKS